MTASERGSWEVAKVEYASALQQYRHLAGLRRQDMAFVTTVQGAVLTIIGERLLDLDPSSLLLSVIAVFVLLLGVNSERRVSAYMVGNMRRANEIELEHGMSLLSSGRREVQERKMLFTNRIVFPFYYFIFIVVWISVWILNLLT